MIRDFLVAEESKQLLDLPLKAKLAHDNSDNPELSEWAIGVKWLASYSAEDAKTFKGVFENKNVVCELKHAETVELLEREFGIVS